MSNKTKIEAYGTSRFKMSVPPQIVNQVMQEIWKSGDINKLYDQDYIKTRIDEEMSLMIHGIVSTFDYEQNRKNVRKLE